MKLAPLSAMDVGISISVRSLVKVFSSRPPALICQIVSRFNPGAGVELLAATADEPATQIVPEASIQPAVATSSPEVPSRSSQSFAPCEFKAEINPSLLPREGDVTNGEVVDSTVPIRKIPDGEVINFWTWSPPEKLVETVG